MNNPVWYFVIVINSVYTNIGTRIKMGKAKERVFIRSFIGSYEEAHLKAGTMYKNDIAFYSQDVSEARDKAIQLSYIV